MSTRRTQEYVFGLALARPAALYNQVPESFQGRPCWNDVPIRVGYRLRGMKRWGTLLSGSVNLHDPGWLPPVGLAAEDFGLRLEA